MSDGLLPPDEWETLRKPHKLHAEFRAWIHYDPVTGVMTRIKSGKGAYVGRELTLTKHYDARGYGNLTAYINGQHRMVGPVIWCYMTGYMPTRKDTVLFVNGNLDDLRWNNMRLMKKSEYLHLTNSCIGKSMGVMKSGDKFVARIRTHANIQTSLGRFDTEKQARVAYLAEKARIRKQIGEKYGITYVNRVAIRRQQEDVATNISKAA